jgi:hypothetical protein
MRKNLATACIRRRPRLQAGPRAAASRRCLQLPDTSIKTVLGATTHLLFFVPGAGIAIGETQS